MLRNAQTAEARVSPPPPQMAGALPRALAPPCGHTQGWNTTTGPSSSLPALDSLTKSLSALCSLDSSLSSAPSPWNATCEIVLGSSSQSPQSLSRSPQSLSDIAFVLLFYTLLFWNWGLSCVRARVRIQAGPGFDFVFLQSENLRHSLILEKYQDAFLLFSHLSHSSRMCWYSQLPCFFTFPFLFFTSLTLSAPLCSSITLIKGL